MGLLAYTGCIGNELLSGVILTTSALPFSPAKLLVFVVWFYLCLYCVQRAQYSSLIAKPYRMLVSISSFVIGPVIFSVLFLIDVIKGYREGEVGILIVVREHVWALISGISSVGVGKKGSSIIELLDSSGRNLKEVYGSSSRKSSGDSHVLSLTEDIIWNALVERASDILIDPKSDSIYTVRFRIDGVLSEFDQIGSEVSQAVINSVKAVSGMDIAEKRRPQDGAFLAKTQDMTVSFRVATAGVVNGEKLSVRVLNQSAEEFKLTNVGLTGKQQLVLKTAIAQPSGMLLLCGPTGSGKTTTLYGMLNEIDLFTRNVITVEDPIEHVLPNASQIEINPKADITFAKSLRSILRQDPDVICVGEIRDEETAGIALRASQTGHLVLATIHSNSNASALVRLLDLDISPLLISSSLNLLVSQRLLRRLCVECKRPAKLSDSLMYDLRKKKINYTGFFEAASCEHCRETGYKGRVAVFDFLVFDRALRESFSSNNLSIMQLRKEGDKKGKSNLYKQGLKKVVAGLTSLEELKRVVG